MSRFRSLTSRLAITALTLVAVVSLLLGVATTLVMSRTLTGRLDDDVRAALDRAQNSPPTSFDQLPEPDPFDEGGRGGRGGREDGGPRQDIGTLTVYFPTGFDDPVASTITDDSSGGVLVQGVSDEALDEIAEVPLDGRAREIDLPGLGTFRMVGSDEGQAALVGLPTRDVDDALSSLVVAELVLGLLAVLAAGGAATLAVRRQLRPLREVADTAHRVAELPLSSGAVGRTQRVPGHLTDEQTEVGQVGSALNTLLQHVEESLDARHRSEQQVRQFVADASHELRTPLATIQGYAELAQRRPDDLAAVGQALGKVAVESARMSALVEDLLLLARLDAGRPLVREPVDLTRLLLEAVTDARVLSPGHRWRLELPGEPIEVVGDEQRLHQVVTNLLTNARKHTPDGTTVTVTGEVGGFAVHDDGPGFDPDLAAHAFERFTRGDTARTREGVSSAGLGLALVAAIVAAHRGSVTLASQPGDTRLRVELP